MQGQEKTREKSGELYRLIETISPVCRFEQGTLIYLQSDEPTNFYVIKSGKIKSFVITEEGKQMTLELLTDGMIVGATSFFNGLPRPTATCAVTDVELFAIDYAKLEPHLVGSRSLMRDMFALIGHSILSLNVQLSSLMLPSAEKKIAHILLNMGGYFKTKPDDGCYTLPYTHSDVAELAGVNRVTATKTLLVFKEKGLLEQGYKNLTILDEEALRAVLDESAE